MHPHSRINTRLCCRRLLQVVNVGDALAPDAALLGGAGAAGIFVDLFADDALLPQLTQVRQPRTYVRPAALLRCATHACGSSTACLLSSACCSLWASLDMCLLCLPGGPQADTWTSIRARLAPGGRVIANLGPAVDTGSIGKQLPGASATRSALAAMQQAFDGERRARVSQVASVMRACGHK